MIRYQSNNQLTIEEFKTPFELKLSRENRWVKLAAVLPWDELAKIYHRALSVEQGRPSVDARRVIGALIIKHKEVMSDEDTIEEIQENVYQQYFLGLKQYQYEVVFDPSLFVTIRKRIGVEAFDAMVQEFIRVANEPTKKKNNVEEQTNTSPSISQKQNEPPAGTPTSSDISTAPSQESQSLIEGRASEHTNAGMLIADMTVAPADITYPTDIELLNTAREKTEELIDVLYQESHEQENTTNEIKPRTYRRKARRDYLAFAKKRKKSLKTIRKALRKQLGYVGRNIQTIQRFLDIIPDALSYSQMRTF